MTHDYAKKKKPRSRANTKKKPAPKRSVPGWVWLLTGLLAGIFICFVAYLAGIAPQTPVSREQETVANQAPANKGKATTADRQNSATKFDFYTLLPEREVIVPDEPEDPEAEAQVPTIYLLQAGSFKQAEDADRLRAKLILMGLTAQVEAVTVSTGEEWHRVQVGPFHDRSRLSKARNMLISQGIDTLLLKHKLEQ